MIKALKPLVMMQLKDKIDLSWLKSKRDTIIKIVLSILAFGAVTALICVGFYFARMLHIFHLANIIPVSVIVVIFTVMEILSLITCTYGIMNTLYFSKDNPVLLTLPVTNNQVFLSKILVYLVYELKKNLYFLVPLFLAYGIIAGLPIYFYFWLIFAWLLISVMTVAISSLLSILAMFISMFLRNFTIIKIALFLGIVGVGVWVIVSLINMIPANLDIIAVWGKLFWDIQEFLKNFTTKMAPFTYLTQFVIGGYVGLKPQVFSLTTLWVLLVIIGIIGASMGLSFLISRPLFFKMASKPFEYRKITREIKRPNIRLNSFFSSVKTQTLMICRTSSDLFSLMGMAIALPIMILLLNRIFAAMSTRLVGDYMTVSFNLLIIILFALATNGKIASIYSREGAAAYLNKTRPNEYRSNLIAKLMPNAIVMTISIIVSCIVFSRFAPIGWANTIWFSITALFVYYLHLLWSAEMDIMNPQSQHYATTGEHNNNPNETKSSLIMFILAAAYFGISLFLSTENIKVAWVKVVVITIALLAFRIWSYLSKIKYYYKEK